MNRAYLMLISAVFLWGLTVVPMKWTLDTVQPFTLMFFRLLLAGLLLLPLVWLRRSRVSGKAVAIPWMRLAMLSFTGVAGYFLMNTYGISLTSGVNASIISATLPLFTLLLAALYLKEQILLTQWVGLVLGIGGFLMVTIQPQSLQQAHSLWGDFLVLASQFIWTVYVVQLKRPKGEEKLSSELFTALIFRAYTCRQSGHLFKRHTTIECADIHPALKRANELENHRGRAPGTRGSGVGGKA